MGSFGDYTIAKSSSVDINNIKWTKKNHDTNEKPKQSKEKTKKSPLNIIYTDDVENPTSDRIFKIQTEHTEQKKKKTEKKIKTTSTSNSKIQYSFSRRGR